VSVGGRGGDRLTNTGLADHEDLVRALRTWHTEGGASAFGVLQRLVLSFSLEWKVVWNQLNRTLSLSLSLSLSFLSTHTLVQSVG
jgi:hypothetical protein